VIIVMDWTLFEFIRARQFGAALEVRGPLMMMMHEDWGAAQNYVVEDSRGTPPFGQGQGMTGSG
jgi:hypothetical protein